MMNPKSKMVLTRYLNKLDNNDAAAQEDGEFEPSFRCACHGVANCKVQYSIA